VSVSLARPSLGRVVPAGRGPRATACVDRGAHVITSVPPRPHRSPDSDADDLLVPWEYIPLGRHRREAP